MKLTIKSIGLAILSITLLIILSGCGKSVSQIAGEKAAENAIERALEKESGGKADVDLSSGSVKMNSEDGNLEIGDNVKLPDNFPSDVHVASGNVKSFATSNNDNGFTVTIESDKSIVDLVSEYKEKLSADGWKISGTVDFGEYASISAEKDNRSVLVMLNKSDGKTSIVLSTGNE